MYAMKEALGCMYGQLIGDALGSRYEFCPAVMVRRMIKTDRAFLTNDPIFVPMLGGGPFQLQPGQVTDDSEMALSLASSLIRCGTFNVADIASSYVLWAQTNPPDIGIATRKALSIKKHLSWNWEQQLSSEEKEEVHQEVLANVRRYNSESLSNGCLMRISPLAIYSLKEPVERVKEMVRADCALTHCNEDCKEAAYAYVIALRDLLNGKTNQEAFKTALSVTQSGRIREHLMKAQEKPIPVKLGEREVDGDGEAMGYIGVALQSAFYELLHGTSFKKSLVDAISRGGDTDTNGAIVGAMCGARFGVTDIPEEWITTLKECTPRLELSLIDYNVERVVENLLK